MNTTDTPPPGAEPVTVDTITDDAPRPGRGTARAPRWKRPSWADRAKLARGAGDLAALAMLVAVVWSLQDNDGGSTRQSLAPIAALAVLMAPLLVREAARLPGWARAGVAAWGLGFCLSLALALDRTAWVTETLRLALLPVVLLAALRLWRRRWGPAALAALLVVSFGAYWHRSFLQWWGHTMLESQPRWLALSWHNQSGILMGGFALLFGGLAMSHRRVLGAGATLAAGAGLAGVWLSSSRGALVFTALGVAVLAVASVRARTADARLRDAAGSVAARLVAIGVAAAMVTTVLLAMFSGPSPLESRNEDAVGSLTRRFLHMEAAVGMAVDHPLGGTGPGSYREVAYLWTRPSSNLTSSAHNEYAEAFAEEGVIFGLAVLALAAATAGGVLLTLRRPPRAGRDGGGRGLTVDDFRGPLTLGMAGAASALGAHAAIDFDWNYPILPALLLVCTAGLVGAGPDGGRSLAGARRPDQFRWGGLVVLPVVGLLAAGFWGNMQMAGAGEARAGLSAEDFAATPVGWDSARLTDYARRLSGDGESDAARLAIDRALAWSPGNPQLQTVRAIVDYEAGELDVDGLVASLDPQRSQRSTYPMVARTLVDGGEYGAAREVLDVVLPLYPEYREWGVHHVVHGAWKLLVEIAALDSGCDEARITAERGALQPYAHEVPGAADELRARADEVCARLTTPG